MERETERGREIDRERECESVKSSAAKCAYSTVFLRIYRGFHHGIRHLATKYEERHAFSAMHNLSF